MSNNGTGHTDQPMPVPNDRPSIQSLVRTDLEDREQIGIARYGTSLQPFNGRDALRDAYEEVMDLTLYLRQAIEERNTHLPERGSDEEAEQSDAEPVPGEPEPDYLRDYRENWAHIVEHPDGTLNRDQVARELADYAVVMDQASQVYDELTGGRLSKPNTAAHHVISHANDRAAADHAVNLLCTLYDQMTSDEDRAALVEYATSQYADAWVEHERLVERRARVADTEVNG